MGKEFSDHDYLAAEIASKSKRSLEIKTFYAINDNKNKKSKIHSLANSYKGELASQTVLLFKDIVSNKSKKANIINSIYEKALANNDMSEAQLMVDWAAILNGYTAKWED